MESANSCGWLQATKLMVWVLLLSSCFTSTNQEEIIKGCFMKTKPHLLTKSLCSPHWTEIKYCEGRCPSTAGPVLDVNTTVTNPNQIIISKAECCRIKKSINRQIILNCVDRNRTYQLPEPTSCECSHCEHI